MTKEFYCFPPLLRLRKSSEYKSVFANPIRSTDKYFTILAINNDLHHSRLGLAIAKKNIKLAVSRNRIKRSVRENFRLKQYQLGNLDIVVLARREAAKAPRELMNQSLNGHWLRLVDRCVSSS